MQIVAISDDISYQQLRVIPKSDSTGEKYQSPMMQPQVNQAIVEMAILDGTQMLNWGCATGGNVDWWQHFS